MSSVIDESAPNERADFYRRIDQDNLYPLWEAVAELMTKGPQTAATLHLWHYNDVRPHVVKSAALVSGEEAERRTLMLENPSMRGKRRITEALYTGLQCHHAGGNCRAPPAHTVRNANGDRERRRLHLCQR